MFFSHIFTIHFLSCFMFLFNYPQSMKHSLISLCKTVLSLQTRTPYFTESAFFPQCRIFLTHSSMLYIYLLANYLNPSEPEWSKLYKRRDLFYSLLYPWYLQQFSPHKNIHLYERITEHLTTIHTLK